jgi:NAD+ synthase
MDKLEALTSRIILWIRRQVDEAGARGTVTGISGGVDSAVVAALCYRALGDQALGLILPCHSSPQDVEDAHLVAKEIGINFRLVDLSSVYDRFLEILPEGPHMARANIKPRLRMVALYYFSNAKGLLVAGTSNASELAVGYFTKYGDGAADILPIGGLMKEQVRELARHLGIPHHIIQKPPSAGLWDGQTDEDEMGITYAQLDAYLRGETLEPSTSERIKRMITSSQHKRRLPLVFTLS